MAFKITRSQRDELLRLVDAYAAARSDLCEFLDTLAGEWEDEFSDKSEAWQRGEKGQEAQERIDTLRSWIEQIPEDSPVDLEEIE